MYDYHGIRSPKTRIRMVCWDQSPYNGNVYGPSREVMTGGDGPNFLPGVESLGHQQST